MNRLRITNFSNPYSPKSIGYLSPFNKTLNHPKTNRSRSGSPTLSMSPRHAPRSPKTGTDPTRLQTGQIANLPCVDDYKKANRLKLGKEKINKILYSLSIDEQSRRNLQTRVKTGNQYLKYQRNPLSQIVNDNQPIVPSFPKKKSNQQPQKTLLDALQDLKSQQHRKNLQKKVQKSKSNAASIVMQLKNNLNKAKLHKPIFEAKSQNILKTLDLSANLADIARSPFEELDDILNLKDENYFMKKRNQEPFNMFQLKFNPKSPMFRSGREQLENIYFSFDSMSTNSPSNSNEMMVRALSTYARISMIKSSSKSIPDDFQIKQHNFKLLDLDKIETEELMLIVTGQIRPHIIKQFINDELEFNRKRIGDDQKTVTKEEEANAKEDKVIYRNRLEHKLINFNVDNFQKTELHYLKRDHLAPIQIKQTQLSTEYLSLMKKTLVKQLQCLNNIIQDRSIHQDFNKQKDKIMLDQLFGDVDLSRRMLETEKKIRFNKMYKNQTEKIKLKLFSQTCKERKILEHAIKAKSQSKKLVRRQSKSKSKSKSQPKKK